MNKVDFASYAHDNTPYVIGNGVKEAINSLEETSYELFYWFANNQMKANPDKCTANIRLGEDVLKTS